MPMEEQEDSSNLDGVRRVAPRRGLPSTPGQQEH